MFYLAPRKYNNKRKIKWAVCLLLCVALSCNNAKEKEEKKTEEDSVTMTQDITAEDSALIFENNADKWLDLSLHNNTGSWKKFKLKEFWYDDSMEKKYFKPSPEFYKDYAPLLKWSPDSSYVLDIGTYGKVLVKDKMGNTKIEDGEVDTKASLLFPKADSSAELIFLGASGNFIDGHWIDSTHFSILGVFDEKGNQQPDTILWLIDAKEKFFRKYKLE
jgi:hypothetical protein